VPTPARLALLAATTLALPLPLILAPAAHAETRGVLRLGVTSVELVPTEATPMIGAELDRVVDAYNVAAVAYNRAHGYESGDAMATAAIDHGAVAVRTTLFTIAPALEVGNRHAFVRLDGNLGLGDDYRAYGLGLYPLNLALPLRRGTVVPYLSAGATASWLDRLGVAGDLGALVSARVAVGVRVNRRITAELGYGAFVLGGFIDRAGLETMSDYDPRGGAPPPDPDAAIAGGEQRGAVDLSFGVAM